MELDFPKPQFSTEKIAYYTFGGGQTTLLLVHGSFGNATMWQRLISQLTRPGFKVVALDLQGHGQSRGFDLAKTTMDDYSENIKSVLKAVGNQAVLLGHSMSGLSVLMVAADLDQINKVISIDPSPSKEIQGEKSAEGIPDIYNVIQAGMPIDHQNMIQSMPDIEPEMFPKISQMLGEESGRARRQRKLGITIPKEKLASKKVLFLGAEYGDSLPFGISAASTKKMAEYYGKPYFEIPGASHPGMLVGKSSAAVAQKVISWL